jgi:NADPH:quinone reductase-like Zn-dependent oxidoreductase
MQRNLSSLGVDGRLIQIAFLQPSKTEVDWIGLMVKRLTFTGSTLRPRTAGDKAQMASELKTKVWPMLEKAQCLPVIHQVFNMTEAVKAHELMESSVHIGKIMLKVAAD